MTEVLKTLFRQTVGCDADSLRPLTPAGSNRRYYRLQAGDISLVGVVGTSIEENEAFLAIDSQLHRASIHVPEVRAVSDDKRCYLQEDLGDVSLFSLIQQDGVEAPHVWALLTETMRQLPAIQFQGAEGFDFSNCYPSASMDRRDILWDLNYFKYCYLKATGVDFLEASLEDDFERFADVLLGVPSDTFLYRDFQSRNVMVHDGQPWFIDFQGGRRGPIYYDVASFLWQARAGFTDEQRDRLIDVYLDALQTVVATSEGASKALLSKETFLARLRYFVLFRLLQVLGA